MILGVADDADAPAVGAYHIAFGNALLRIVGAFGVNVRADGEQQLPDGRLREDSDEIHGPDRGDDLRPLALRHERPPLALLGPYLLVRSDPDDQQVAQCLGAFEVADVPDVKEVE